MLKHISALIKNSPRTVRGSEKVFRKWLVIVLKVIFECFGIHLNTLQLFQKIVREQSGVPKKISGNGLG